MVLASTEIRVIEGWTTNPDITVALNERFKLVTNIRGGIPNYTIRIYMSSLISNHRDLLIADYTTSDTATSYTYSQSVQDLYSFYAVINDSKGNSYKTNTVYVRVR